MSLYQKIAEVGQKFVAKHILFKYGFNWSPMYRRSTAKITEVSKDLLKVYVKLPINYKNRNYVNSIFGGSMFAAVDPIPMVQLINLIGEDYVVWDKSAQIYFKKPARSDVYAEFSFSEEELKDIKKAIEKEKEIEIIKTTLLTDKQKYKVYCEVRKTLYVADKAFYKNKRQLKNKS